MAIKLNDLSGVTNIIKIKYGQNLHEMNFIFCFQKDPTSYFIFQEIQGMPIKRLVYHEENNSITFVASWSSWSNPYSLIADANFHQIENWKDLQDRSRPHNSYIEEGGFEHNCWKSVNKKNRTEIKKKHKNKSDVFVEFRVDKIQRANFNNWGFELYSKTISILAFNSRHQFPYTVRDVENHNGSIVGGSDYGFNNTPPVDEDGVFINKITWQGGSFVVPEFESSEEVSQVSDSQGMPGGNNCDLSSYWSSKEEDEENDQFDEEIADILLDNRIDDDTIFDIGQRKVNLYFGDD